MLGGGPRSVDICEVERDTESLEDYTLFAGPSVGPSIDRPGVGRHLPRNPCFPFVQVQLLDENVPRMGVLVQSIPSTVWVFR